MKVLILPLNIVVLFLMVFSGTSQANSLDTLLNNVKDGSLQKTKEAASLERRFKSASNEEKVELVKKLIAEKKDLEKNSQSLSSTYDEKEVLLNKLRGQLQTELGDMKALLAIVQQIVGESQASFESSLISAQFTGREEQFRALNDKLSQSNQLLTITEIKEVWSALLKEMVEQGKTVNFEAPVATISGGKKTTTVTRVGVFNLIADGKFLSYGKAGLAELSRQPESRFLSQAAALQSAAPGLNVTFPVDPTMGILLNATVDRPSIIERVEQGGLVGKVIIAMGLIALLVALYKIISLSLTSISVKRQAKRVSKISLKNPLGRVLSVFNENEKSDTEALELKLSEAIMRETPKLNSWLMFIKIISVVAPLMGLLGTVTGMIETFQSITLFGAGDPKLMAGGISQALVTTVLGLVVAIPSVLLYTAAASRAKRVQEILEEQSTGIVARQVEKAMV